MDAFEWLMYNVAKGGVHNCIWLNSLCGRHRRIPHSWLSRAAELPDSSFGRPRIRSVRFFLVQRGRGHWGRTVSLTVLVVATVFLLSLSGVYYLLAPGTGRNVMRQLDVAANFGLIAGTVTPARAILFRGFNRWAPLFLVCRPPQLVSQ